jgi:hypothetical protein
MRANINGTNTLVHLRMVAHNLSLYDEMGRSTFHIVKFNNICTHEITIFFVNFNDVLLDLQFNKQKVGWLVYGV